MPRKVKSATLKKIVSLRIELETSTEFVEDNFLRKDLRENIRQLKVFLEEICANSNDDPPVDTDDDRQISLFN